MARFLFVTWPGSGNQVPTLGIAQALREHGHSVTFAGYVSQRERFAARGFPLTPMERSSSALQRAPKGDVMAALVATVWATPDHLADVRDAVERESPDVLVVDCLLFGVLAAAESMGANTAVLVHSAPGLLEPPDGPFEQTLLLAPINAVRASAGLAPVAHAWDVWARFPTLCASLRVLDPLADQAPESFRYVGPVFERMPDSGWRAPWAADDTHPLVLVSFSAGDAWDQTSRIQRTLVALAETPVRVLVTAGSANVSGLTIPDNAVVIPGVPHAEVLPSVAAVVTHGGHGTVTAALAHAVPVICLPNLTSDQPGIAAQIAALGAGLALDGDAATPDDIRAAVVTVLREPSYAAAARRLAAMIAESHSAEASVTLLKHVAGAAH